jgi:hypothetical protein
MTRFADSDSDSDTDSDTDKRAQRLGDSSGRDERRETLTDAGKVG